MLTILVPTFLECKSTIWNHLVYYCLIYSRYYSSPYPYGMKEA